MRSGVRRFPGLSWVLLTSLPAMVQACRPSGTTVEPSPLEPSQEAIAPPPPAPKASRAVCGPAGLRIQHFGWLPDETTAVAQFDLLASELPTALTRATAFVRAPDHGLPIEMDFAIAQWSWQLPGLRSVLGTAGFEPADLVYLRILDGTPVWLFPLQCDLEDALVRVQQAWGVDVRRTVGGVIGTPGSTQTFAFDVVFLDGERVALTPAGAGSRVLEHFGSTQRGVGAPPIAALATTLESLEPATIRLVIRLHGLLEPSSNSADTGEYPLLRAFRGTSASFRETDSPR